MSPSKIYLKGLNGLRFIAAFSVFLAHAGVVTNWINKKPNNALYGSLGFAGVALFFVISGYLITYLLLAEKDNFQTIKLRDFYIRRVLRIWPLYYFIMIVTLFVIPGFCQYQYFDLQQPLHARTVILYVFFMPYVAISLVPVNFLAIVLWSVGVEETYYLFWPVLIKYAQKVNLRFFLVVLLAFISLKAVITYIPFKIDRQQHLLHHICSVISQVFFFLRLESMIIGGTMAYMVKTNHPIVGYIKRKYVFSFSVIALVYYVIFSFNKLYFNLNPFIETMIDPCLFSVLAGCVIINITAKESINRFLENKFIFELGQVSYGIYMYHTICLLVTCLFLDRVMHLDPSTLLFPTLLVFISAILIVAVSYFSYHYFEMRFLRFKARFTHIVSGVQAKEDR